MKWFFLLVLLSPASLRADWRIIDRRDSRVAEGKLAASEFRVTDGDAEAEVNLVYFAVAGVTLEVVSNTDGQIQGLRDLIQSRGGLAGVNGGYFAANLDPVGLLISNNHVVHPLQRAKLLSGIFYVKNGRPWLARILEFPGTKGIQEAVQCGPFLVDGGRTVAGLDHGRVAARTFVFSCSPTMWGFGICRSASLEEMGNILTQTAVVSDHPVIRALNLDGGSSTTFYVKTDDRTIFSEGRAVVSNYLVVKAKN